jgi:hypothetical protein
MLYVHRAGQSYCISDLSSLAKWAAVAQSVQQLATGWTVLGSIAGGFEIFHTLPDRPGAPYGAEVKD